MQYNILFVLLVCVALACPIVGAGGVANKKYGKIDLGQDVGDAIKKLERIRVDVTQVDFGAVDFGGEDRNTWKKYIVKPKYKSSDALVLIAKFDEQSDAFIIKEMHWHIKYYEELLLPKSHRATRLLNLHSVDPRVLELNENVGQKATGHDPNPFD